MRFILRGVSGVFRDVYFCEVYELGLGLVCFYMVSVSSVVVYIYAVYMDSRPYLYFIIAIEDSIIKSCGRIFLKSASRGSLCLGIAGELVKIYSKCVLQVEALIRWF